jgi:hypothetical protein
MHCKLLSTNPILHKFQCSLHSPVLRLLKCANFFGLFLYDVNNTVYCLLLGHPVIVLEMILPKILADPNLGGPFRIDPNHPVGDGKHAELPKELPKGQQCLLEYVVALLVGQVNLRKPVDPLSEDHHLFTGTAAGRGFCTVTKDAHVAGQSM